MAMPTAIPASQAPSYIIYRDAPAGELYDPTAPLAFFPPKDSDELFDALRAKYPHLKSHSERMRDATIEFLLEERQAESLSTNVSPAMPSLYDSMPDTSPWQQSWPSASMTTLSSPDMTNLATPAFGDSPKPRVPQLSRQQSCATPSESQTPAIDQMTSVFSLSTSEQPKQRVRRKMTEAEKIEYRKRRIVKACDKCSKRKRKCIHNQPEMEGLKNNNDKAHRKVTKPRSNTTKASQHAEVPFSSFDFSTADASDMFNADSLIGGYEDFTLMFDPTPDFSFDETPTFDMSQNFTYVDNFTPFTTQNFESNNAKPTWHQNHMQDWNVLESNMSNSFSSYTESTEAANNFPDLMVPHHSQIDDSSQTRLRCDFRTSQVGPLQTSSTRSSATDQFEDRSQRTPSSSVGSSSDGLSLPQTPTHTAHVHNVQAQQVSYHVDDGLPGGLPGASNTAEDSRKRSGGSAALPATAGSGQPLSNTALQRPVRMTGGANRSAASDDPQSNNVRHRLRSTGLMDPALQGELSSTSATSYSSVSNTENATALEGRPAVSGALSSSQSSPRGVTNSRRVVSDSATTRSILLSRSASAHEDTAPLSSVTMPTASLASTALQPQSTRASSALLARPSPFDSSDSAPTRSTELFRLRHRISTSLVSALPASSRATSSSSLSTQANGGLLIGSTGGIAGLALQAQAHANRQPVTTLASTEETQANANRSDGTRKIFTENETGRCKDHHGRPNTLFTESETNRYKDHHGQNNHHFHTESERTAYQASYSLSLAVEPQGHPLGQMLRTVVAAVALGTILLLASTPLHVSIVTLALFAPVSVAHSDRSWLSTMRSKAQTFFSSQQRKGRLPLGRHTLPMAACN